MTKLRRNVPHRLFTCKGGPFDGKEIKLSVDGPYVASAYLSIRNWWRGRYVQDPENRDCVKWEVGSGTSSSRGVD